MEPPATQPRPEETPLKAKPQPEDLSPSSANAPTLILGELSPTLQQTLEGEGQDVKRLHQLDQRADKRAKGKAKEENEVEDAKSDDSFGETAVPKSARAKAKAQAKAIVAKAKAKAKDIESKAKAKAKSKSRAQKASPKGKAKAKGKAKPDKTRGKSSKAGKGKRKAESSVKASFARRNQPDREPGHSFWKAVRTAFESVIQDKVRSPSTWEVPFWKHCQQLWDEVLPAGEIAEYDAAAHSIAKDFLLTPDVRGCWDIAFV